eukprot:6208777-Pleurochrysis_carterae.AAC.1
MQRGTTFRCSLYALGCFLLRQVRTSKPALIASISFYLVPRVHLAASTTHERVVTWLRGTAHARPSIGTARNEGIETVGSESAVHRNLLGPTRNDRSSSRNCSCRYTPEDNAPLSAPLPQHPLSCPLQPEFLLGVSQSGSSLILTSFEELLAQHAVIVAFLTMLVGAGGNAGNQVPLTAEDTHARTEAHTQIFELDSPARVYEGARARTRAVASI